MKDPLVESMCRLVYPSLEDSISQTPPGGARSAGQRQNKTKCLCFIVSSCATWHVWVLFSVECHADFCDEKFKTNSARQQHERDVHMQSEMLICYFCGKPSQRGTTFRRHVQQHQKNRAGECSFCKKRFKNAAGLAHHLRNSNCLLSAEPAMTKTRSNAKGQRRRRRRRTSWCFRFCSFILFVLYFNKLFLL